MSMLLRPDVEAFSRVEKILEDGPFVPGTRAVHRVHFLYDLRWSQAGARISEMNDLGWKISSIALPESQWVNGVRTAYRLDSKPLQTEIDSQPQFHRTMSTARRSARAWKPQSITPSRTWSDVVREREEKLADRETEFQLTP